MLNIAESAAPGGRERPLEGFSTSQTLQALRATISRHLWIIISCVALSLTVGIIFLATTAPRFKASALLIIDSKKSQTIQQQSPLGIEAPVDTATVDSQVEILKSESIANVVIKEQHLTEVDEYIGPGGNLVGSFFDFVSRIFSDGTISEYQLNRKALERFERRLSVRRLGLSYVIQIDFESTDPLRAANIANAVAEAYIVDSLEAKYQASRRAAAWLQDRLKTLRSEAAAAERAAVDYRAQNKIVDAGGRLLNEQQLAEMNSALTVARAQKSEAQARLDRITGILAKEDSDDGSLVNELATVADTLRNDVITRLRQQYLDLSNRSGDWARRYGMSHQAVLQIRAQMREIQRSIADELRRIAETYKSDFEISKSREENAQKNLDETVRQSNVTSQAQIALRELESNSQSYRALADNFLQLYMVSVQQQSFPITEARLITSATPPRKPSFPNGLLVLTASLIGGSGLGILIALYRDFSDRTIRTADHMRNMLGFDCLATLPKLKESELRSSRRHQYGAPVDASLRRPGDPTVHARSALQVNALQPVAHVDGGGFNRGIVSDGTILAHCKSFPFSRFSEGLRSIRVAAQLYEAEGKNTVLGVTSAMPNEGKSTVAAALAHTIAVGGTKTLLIDGDLRNPSLTSQLSPSAKAGLVDVILGQAELRDVLWTDPDTGLRFLPTIADGALANSHDILLSSATEKLFDSLRRQFDQIIVDLSPLAPIVDARATNRYIDAYLLIVEWGSNNVDVVSRAIDESFILRDRIVGGVLNKANLKALRKYSPHQADYFNSPYYERYGYR